MKKKWLWAEAANMTVKLENIHVRSAGQISHEMMNQKFPKIWEELMSFGEMAVVKDRNKMKSKVSNKGEVMMLTGFYENHPKGTYHFFELTPNP